MAKRKPKLDLEGFELHLRDRGLVDGSVKVYMRDVAIGLREGGMVARLRSEALAPKTKRHVLAAARHWADYTDDLELTKALKKLRLPPARRKKAKMPLERAELFAVLDELKASGSYLPPPVRAVIGMMATRGLRIGDVLRLTRDEVMSAKEDGTLSFEGKGRRRLEFKLLKTYRQHLLVLAAAPGEWERVDDLVAPGASPEGRRTAAARAIERAMVKLGVRIGVFNFHPHRLRRTYAVEYLRSMPGDPEALVKLVSHMQWASMNTALEYVDYVRSDDLDAPAERIFDRERK